VTRRLAVAILIIVALATLLLSWPGFPEADEARAALARTQLLRIAHALEFYRLDNGRYPTTEEGLRALVHPPDRLGPSIAREETRYLSTLPVDPWKSPYQYRSPVLRHPDAFDLWSWGSDRSSGGTGHAADVYLEDRG
jgi:general secretion pathway protein G